MFVEEKGSDGNTQEGEAKIFATKLLFPTGTHEKLGRALEDGRRQGCQLSRPVRLQWHYGAVHESGGHGGVAPIVPLSMPVIFVIEVYVGVWHWMEWLEPLLYVTRSPLKPLQSVLQRLIMETQGAGMEERSGRVSACPVSSTTITMATLCLLVC